MTLRIEIILLLLGMSLVTYVPRMLPAAFIDSFRFGKAVEKFLRLIPYTAMATLIFPGILSVDAEYWWIGVIGGAVAVILSYFRLPMVVAVIGAILANLVTYALIPLF